MIEFNAPAVVGRELMHLQRAIASGCLSSDGPFSHRCEAWLAKRLGLQGALLVHSCTAALEMAALLCDLRPGDEVLMPSFTFVTTASAVALRGAVPVFIDVREDTLNIDETLLEDAVNDRTRAIFPVHYAGVCAEMNEISRVAAKHQLMVVEDAAQALGARYRGRPAGSLGDLACFSFHETKNVISGEGGALVSDSPHLLARAAVMREKGTNRRAFLDGQVAKYTWVDLGSSYGPSELVAAFLLGQLEQADGITRRRREVWGVYHSAFESLEKSGRVRRPVVPPHCDHNGHLYYLLCQDRADRDGFIRHMRAHGVATPFHYAPLHTSPAGQRFGRAHGRLARTEDLSDRLVRLPLHLGVREQQEKVIDAALRYLGGGERRSGCSLNRGVLGGAPPPPLVALAPALGCVDPEPSRAQDRTLT